MRTKNIIKKTAIAFAVSQTFLNSAQGAVLVVDSLLDNQTPNNGLCTLREAIVSVNTATLNPDCSGIVPSINDTILFDPSITVNDTIALTSGQLLINKDLTLTGPVGDARLTIDQQTATSRVLRIDRPGMYESSPVVTLNNLIFSGGNPYYGGGGINVRGGANVTINDSTISNNSATTGFGGGIVVEFFSSLTLNGSTVSNNSATTISGGIDVFYSSLTINNSTISLNSATENGGGIYLNNSTATLNSAYLVFNSSSGRGGGINATNSLLNITNNTRVRQSVAVGNGGGISAANSEINIRGNSDISYSYVSGKGGGLWSNNSVITVEDGAFFSNTASVNGGGVSLEGNQGSFTMDRGILFLNRSYNFGGAVYLANTSATLTNATISNNAADDRGGGILANNGGAISLTNATLVANSAGLLGGGINLYEGAGGTSASISNSIILANGATNGSEVAVEGVVGLTLKGVNLLGDSEQTSATSFFGFTPRVSDIVATSDGNNPRSPLTMLNPATIIDGAPSTLAHTIPPGSPAIAAADPGECTDLDQRMVDRELTFLVPIRAANSNIAIVDLGNACDIGTVAFTPSAPPIPPKSSGGLSSIFFPKAED